MSSRLFLRYYHKDNREIVFPPTLNFYFEEGSGQGLNIDTISAFVLLNVYKGSLINKDFT